jgi:hypothetical protein
MAIFVVFKPGQRPGGTLIEVRGRGVRAAPTGEITTPGLF